MKEVKEIDMMLGRTTREVELSSIQIVRLTVLVIEFSLSVEVTIFREWSLFMGRGGWEIGGGANDVLPL
jgi:hypothetical protein